MLYSLKSLLKCLSSTLSSSLILFFCNEEFFLKKILYYFVKIDIFSFFFWPFIWIFFALFLCVLKRKWKKKMFYFSLCFVYEIKVCLCESLWKEKIDKFIHISYHYIKMSSTMNLFMSYFLDIFAHSLTLSHAYDEQYKKIFVSSSSRFFVDRYRNWVAMMTTVLTRVRERCHNLNPFHMIMIFVNVLLLM